MKDEEFLDYKRTEKLINLVADSQSFLIKNDKLTQLLNKYSLHFEAELCEEELVFATAAAKPAVPKYKIVNNLL